MVGRGHMTAEEREAQELRRDVTHRVPTEKPPFTLGQLKKAIPPRCFERSVIRSFSYLVYDLIIVSALLYLALDQIPSLPSPFNYLSWPLYWVCQGCVLLGVFMIAHECGHHAFSDYQLLDDIVGLVLHSSLLVPYFSWKYSHRRHHSNTASLERDEVFVPRPKSSLHWLFKNLDNPAGRFMFLFVSLTMGWPLYLAINATGRPYPRFACHYDPYGPIYSDSERAQIFISDAGVLAVFYVLYKLTVAFSLGWVIRIYGVPLLIMNGWMVLITYLHHTHPSLPHYDSSEWDWLRGALSTVDRDYGILNMVFHNISDTHVAHHLFSTMPHYNAMEATKAIKPILGEYYQFDATPVYKALYREVKECVYVEPEGEKSGGVYWYNNKL